MSHQQLPRHGIPSYTWRNEASWKMHYPIILILWGQDQGCQSRSIWIQGRSSHTILPSNFNFLWFSVDTCPQLLTIQLPSLMRKNFVLNHMYKPRVGPSWGTIFRDRRLLQGKKLLSHSHRGCPFRQQTCWSALSDYFSGKIGIIRMQYGAMVG